MTDPKAKEKSFLARVRIALPGLHPAERRLGDFVCDFPGELASYSGSELAQSRSRCWANLGSGLIQKNKEQPFIESLARNTGLSLNLQ